VIDADPLPENVDGQIVEKHTWNHEIEHSIQWDYVLLAIAAVGVAWMLFGGSGESGVDVEDVPSADDGGEPGPFRR